VKFKTQVISVEKKAGQTGSPALFFSLREWLKNLPYGTTFLSKALSPFHSICVVLDDILKNHLGESNHHFSPLEDRFVVYIEDNCQVSKR